MQGSENTRVRPPSSYRGIHAITLFYALIAGIVYSIWFDHHTGVAASVGLLLVLLGVHRSDPDNWVTFVGVLVAGTAVGYWTVGLLLWAP